MIDVPTLFILGAGASKPYGYPTGIELRSEIINNFSSDLKILLDRSSLQNRPKDSIQREAQKFIENFSRSPVNSIDKYLALNPIFSSIGKIAITMCILKKEKTSNFLEKMDFRQSNEDWYRLIFNRMIATLKLPEDFKKFRDNKVAFITYNYDRSLEYFLYNGFYYTFWQNRDTLMIKMKEYVPFPIIHAYGQVNTLQTVDWPDSSNYGGDFDYFQEIENLSKGIRVIGEKADDIKAEVKKLISEYKRIFFLGFGYAIENLDALDLPMDNADDWDIYGTAKGLTKKEIDSVRSIFYKTFVNKTLFLIKPRIEDKNSYELLRDHL